MSHRIDLGRFLLRLGRLVSSLALMVMRPDDLVEASRQSYAKRTQVNYWGSDEVMSKGLTPLEKMILEKINLKQGKILILGLGGGREAIPLAKMGFSVIGVDYIPEMVEKAKENAAKHDVQLDAQVGELSHLAPPPATFDLVWLSESMYSCIPTRRRRVELLKKLNEALQPGGWFACMFHWNPIPAFSPQMDRIRKLFAYLTFGNLWYEPGDLFLGTEFIHGFRDKGELSSEFAEGGFEVIHLYIPPRGDTKGLAILYKAK